MSALCQFRGCPEPATHECENCDTRFCLDHGSAGGDHDGIINARGQQSGCYAVPAVCWKCGGYNADEEAAA